MRLAHHFFHENNSNLDSRLRGNDGDGDIAIAPNQILATLLFVYFALLAVKSSPPTPAPGSHMGLPLQSFLCALCG
jgi:hypothetical protein